MWAWHRRRGLHREYEARRERYAHTARERGFMYREADVVDSVRTRLDARGYRPTPRALGEIHTFAFVPQIGWHAALVHDLHELGPVTLFDYARLGFEWDDFYRATPTGRERRRAMNAMVVPALREAHARRSVDWVFVYASGVEISAATIRQITSELRIPTVNMCLDDKQSWTGAWMGDHRAGQIDIASTFDLSWTSARVACEWYLVEGARPLYMPEGFDGSLHGPMPVTQDILVSFIGSAYGFRRDIIEYLRRHGIPVRTFGPGWGTRSVLGREQVEIINRSVINLGLGGIGYSEDLTNVKTRDFEIPGTGGGLYVTSFNADLAQHFAIGEEIVCYRSRDELLELIRHYLRHPDEAQRIARRARERSLREHRWVHRYRRICRTLGLVDAEGMASPSGGLAASAPSMRPSGE
jgi:glycosyl transferase family 1